MLTNQPSVIQSGGGKNISTWAPAILYPKTRPFLAGFQQAQDNSRSVGHFNKTVFNSGSPKLGESQGLGESLRLSPILGESQTVP